MHEHGEQFRASWIQSLDRVDSNIRLCDLSKEQDTGVFLWALFDTLRRPWEALAESSAKLISLKRGKYFVRVVA